MLLTFVYFPVKGTGKDMKNYLYHPPGLADPFYKVCEGFFVSCSNAFYWLLLYSFLYVNKFDLWHCHGISLILT